MASDPSAGGGREPSRRDELFRDARGLIEQAHSIGLAPETWTFGDGTALMLVIDHRESHDVDLFITDPQFLSCLAQVDGRHTFSTAPTDYRIDGTDALKIVFAHGEIDFICRPSLIADPVNSIALFGSPVLRERPAEILAKKIRFRGARFQPRDVFDLAAILRGAERGTIPGGRDTLLAEIEPVADSSHSAIKTIEGMAPQFLTGVMSQLIIRPD